MTSITMARRTAQGIEKTSERGTGRARRHNPQFFQWGALKSTTTPPPTDHPPYVILYFIFFWLYQCFCLFFLFSTFKWAFPLYLHFYSFLHSTIFFWDLDIFIFILILDLILWSIYFYNYYSDIVDSHVVSIWSLSMALRGSGFLWPHWWLGLSRDFQIDKLSLLIRRYSGIFRLTVNHLCHLLGSWWIYSRWTQSWTRLLSRYSYFCRSCDDLFIIFGFVRPFGLDFSMSTPSVDQSASPRLMLRPLTFRWGCQPRPTHLLLIKSELREDWCILDALVGLQLFLWYVYLSVYVCERAREWAWECVWERECVKVRREHRVVMHVDAYQDRGARWPQGALAA